MKYSRTPCTLRFQFAGHLTLLAAAIGMGASFVRVGFEDSPFFAPGQAAKSNAELVERIVSLVYQIGYEVATTDAAREILKLG